MNFNELYDGTISPGKEKAANIISFVLQPMFLPIPLFLLLSTYASDPAGYAISSFISIATAVVVPTVIVYWCSMKLNRTDGDIPDKEDRIAPMVIISVSYAVGAVLLYLFGAPLIVTAMMVSYLIATVISSIITMKWKISLHAIGTVGMATALTIAFWPYGLIAFVVVPPMYWSRYVLRKHTPAQMLAGTVFSVVVTASVLAVAGLL